MSEDKRTKRIKCNFCGEEHTQEEWKKSGKRLFRSAVGETGEEKSRICSSCLEKGYGKLKKVNKKTKKQTACEIQTPTDIKEYLDDWVIEQERPKKSVATELYAHKKRIQRLDDDPDAAKELRMDKSNMIYLGPTGCGKTELIRAMCSCMDLPYTIEDASSLSATGLRKLFL